MTDEIKQTIVERGKSHGEFQVQSTIAQILKRAMRDTGAYWDRLHPAHHEALDMIAHKMSRILAGDPNFGDHWHDIAGYARCVEERLPLPTQPSE